MLKHLLVLTVTLFALPVWAQETINVDYSYEGRGNFDIRPSITIPVFTDSRSVSSPEVIISSGLGSDAGYVAETALAEIVRDAFVQAFTKAEVELLESGGDMQLRGEITESSAEIIDNNGVESIQLTIRTAIQLQDQGRTRFETNLFGRAVVPAEEGLAAAVRAALDRTIRNLTGDDYFMMELM